jgi:hypothetical protein
MHAGKHEICTVSATNEPMCTCKPGYVHHEKYGCVDVNPPTLKLRHDPMGDQTLRLKQGDEYREFMVDIVDDNAEDYLRSLKVTYSRPLPPGCLTSVGEFHVNYTVAMPWVNPPYVRITRRVIIEDIDECSLDVAKYQRTCPELVPQCDTAAGAQCRNTIGSYTCQCPSNTSGDGFLKTATFTEDHPAPSSYKGGTGCVDTTKPVISIQGPNPKVFKVCACGGLDGVMSPSKNDDDDKELQAEQRKLYESDIRDMIRETAGAELCATHDHPRPTPSDCIKAVDHTYKGDVDLSERVSVGDPVRKSHLHWVVPYNVKDAAGNEATTVYRDIIVQEVDLATAEKKIREEVTREQEQKTKQAIANALREEKRKWELENASNRNRRSGNTASSNTCPACPICDCPETAPADAASCSAFCDNLSASCKLSDENLVYSLLLWLEDVFPAWLVPMFVLTCLGAGVFFLLRWVLVLIFNPRSYTTYDYSTNGNVNDEMLLLTSGAQQRTEVGIHLRSTASETPAAGSYRDPYMAPPAASLSSAMNGGNSGMFSPGSQMGSPFPPKNSLNSFSMNPHTPVAGREEGLDKNSVYQSPPLITPSKYGDGARRRSPFR